jgi:hypothetical protein
MSGTRAVQGLLAAIVLTVRPAWKEGEWVRPMINSTVSIYSKFFKRFELIRSKEILAVFQKFQIKFGFEAFEIRNNFHYWNFSKFRI